MHFGHAVTVALFAVAASAPAVEVDVIVRDSGGNPAGDAVISVRGTTGAGTPSIAQTHVIDQRNETFVPYVEVFRPGDSVVFRNSDRTRHHVYSFAPAKSFEFVIPPGNSSPPVVLDRDGEIAVGCNIHDRMITHLYVSDAPWVAKSDAQGHATFADLPAGHYQMRAWHPQLRPGKQQPDRAVDVGDGTTTVTFELPLLPDPRPDAGDREHSRY